MTVLGNGYVGINQDTPIARLHVVNDTSTDVGLIVEGAVSQSANLVEVKDSSSNDLFTIDSDGNTKIISTANSPFIIANNSLPADGVASAVVFYASGSDFVSSVKSAFRGGTSSSNKVLELYAGGNSSVPKVTISNSGLYTPTGVGAAFIDLASDDIPDVTANKLYNNSGELYFNGSKISQNYIETTGNYTIPITGYGVFISASGDSLIDIGSASVGRELNIIRTDSTANTVTISGAQNINSLATTTLSQYDSLVLVGNSNQWFIK